MPIWTYGSDDSDYFLRAYTQGNSLVSEMLRFSDNAGWTISCTGFSMEWNVLWVDLSSDWERVAGMEFRSCGKYIINV